VNGLLIVDNTMLLLGSRNPSVRMSIVARFQLGRYCDERVLQWQMELNHGSEATQSH
jgi:hypothetical protein